MHLYYYNFLKSLLEVCINIVKYSWCMSAWSLQPVIFHIILITQRCPVSVQSSVKLLTQLCYLGRANTTTPSCGRTNHRTRSVNKEMYYRIPKAIVFLSPVTPAHGSVLPEKMRVSIDGSVVPSLHGSPMSDAPWVLHSTHSSAMGTMFS